MVKKNIFLTSFLMTALHAGEADFRQIPVYSCGSVETPSLICTTPSFKIELDTRYQGKYPFSLILSPHTPVSEWTEFLENDLSAELKKTINLIEMLLIKTLSTPDNLEKNVSKMLINFNGEQQIRINDNGTEERFIFFRFVPRCPAFTLGDDADMLTIEDPTFGKAAYFGAKDSQSPLLSLTYTEWMTTKLRSTLNNDFAEWFNAQNFDNNFGLADTTYDADVHPLNAGLCKASLKNQAQELFYNFNIDARDGTREGRGFLSLLGAKIPAIRFIPDNHFTHILSTACLYQASVRKAYHLQSDDVLFKIASLMNLSTHDPDWHMHLIPIRKGQKDFAEFATNMYVYNVPTHYAYTPLKTEEVLDKKQNLQSELIKTLTHNGATILWPTAPTPGDA